MKHRLVLVFGSLSLGVASSLISVLVVAPFLGLDRASEIFAGSYSTLWIVGFAIAWYPIVARFIDKPRTN